MAVTQTPNVTQSVKVAVNSNITPTLTITPAYSVHSSSQTEQSTQLSHSPKQHPTVTQPLATNPTVIQPPTTNPTVAQPPATNPTVTHPPATNPTVPQKTVTQASSTSHSVTQTPIPHTTSHVQVTPQISTQTPSHNTLIPNSGFSSPTPHTVTATSQPGTGPFQSLITQPPTLIPATPTVTPSAAHPPCPTACPSQQMYTVPVWLLPFTLPPTATLSPPMPNFVPVSYITVPVLVPAYLPFTQPAVTCPHAQTPSPTSSSGTPSALSTSSPVGPVLSQTTSTTTAVSQTTPTITAMSQVTPTFTTMSQSSPSITSMSHSQTTPTIATPQITPTITSQATPTITASQVPPTTTTSQATPTSTTILQATPTNTATSQAIPNSSSPSQMSLTSPQFVPTSPVPSVVTPSTSAGHQASSIPFASSPTSSPASGTTIRATSPGPKPLSTTSTRPSSPTTPQERTTTRVTTPTPTATTPRTTTRRVTTPATTTTLKPKPPAPTTTARPPPVTTPQPNRPAICDNCTMVNGVGYKAHWSSCDLFIQCMFAADGSVTVRIKQCPHGLHWDQASLTCNRPQQAHCPHDRCRQPAFRQYPATNNCRGYWVCVGRVSEGKCCPVGHAFSMSGGCVPSATCTTLCGVSPSPDVCDKRPVAGMPLTFEQYVPGVGWRRMFCAPGTAFNHSACSCADTGHGVLPDCRPELYVPFNGGVVRDESGNNNYIQNEGVQVVGDAGYFDGNSVLRVPRFANTDYGDFVLIRLRYKQDAGPGGGGGSWGPGQALVANGDCLQPSSMYMVADQKGVSFGATTISGQNATVNVPSSAGGWKEAVLYIDKNTLTGSVNSYSMQTLFTGSLASSKCALQIGRGTNFQHYTGLIDDITVYLCRPKTF